MQEKVKSNVLLKQATWGPIKNTDGINLLSTPFNTSPTHHPELMLSTAIIIAGTNNIVTTIVKEATKEASPVQVDRVHLLTDRLNTLTESLTDCWLS